MSKFVFLCFVGAVVSSCSSMAVAQSSAPCQCGAMNSQPVVSSGQTYQRYSYAPAQAQPAAITGSVVAPSQPSYYSAPSVISAPMTYGVPQYSAPMVSSQPMASTQGYRRYSYQPSASGAAMAHRSQWEYPKADSHRYRP